MAGDGQRAPRRAYVAWIPSGQILGRRIRLRRRRVPDILSRDKGMRMGLVVGNEWVSFAPSPATPLDSGLRQNDERGSRGMRAHSRPRIVIPDRGPGHVFVPITRPPVGASPELESCTSLPNKLARLLGHPNTYVSSCGPAGDKRGVISSADPQAWTGHPCGRAWVSG